MINWGEISEILADFTLISDLCIIGKSKIPILYAGEVSKPGF